MAVEEHILHDLDLERADDPCDAPLEEERAEEERDGEEVVEEFGSLRCEEPGERREGGDDYEETAHEEDGGDAAECHLVFGGDGTPRACLVF